jgi:hypothetical protein
MGEDITGSFYEKELTKTLLDEEKAFKIEKIIKYRTRKGRKEALIRWKYYPSSADSWVSTSEIKKYE